jgi:3-hydroxypropanoate dehydrogenase
MPARLPDAALDQLYLSARTNNKWQARDVPDSVLQELVDLAKMGPTSANCQPSRFLFIKSSAAKQRLKPFLSANNAEKTMQAPVCTIVAFDLKFYEQLPACFRIIWRREAGSRARQITLLPQPCETAHCKVPT